MIVFLGITTLMIDGVPSDREEPSEPASGEPRTIDPVAHAYATTRNTCEDLVEAQAKIKFEWTDKLFGPRRMEIEGVNPKQGIVRLSGNQIRFQNIYGTWIPHRYECDVDLESTQILEVRVTRGR